LQTGQVIFANPNGVTFGKGNLATTNDLTLF